MQLPIFIGFCTLFGDQVGVAVARNVFPKCIAGRWLSVATVEERLEAAGTAKILAVLEYVLKGKAVRGPDSTEPAPAPIADMDPRVEEVAEHRAKMGRWPSRRFAGRRRSQMFS